jgi:hypothetical protein
VRARGPNNVLGGPEKHEINFVSHWDSDRFVVSTVPYAQACDYDYEDEEVESQPMSS